MKKRILYIGNDLAINSFTATYISFFSKVLKKEGYEVRKASNKNNKALRLVEMLRLIAKHHKATDVVIIDTYGAMNFYYAYLVAKACQIYNLDYIPILHGGNLPDRLSDNRFLSKSLFGKAKMNVAPSLFLYNIFKEAGFDNLQIIPNSIELRKYPFKERSAFKPRLLWVRRFQGRYNPMLAVKVLENLLLTYPEAQLCMVGPEKDGSMKKCEAYAEKYKLPVTFTGKLKKKEWAAIAKDYDIFLNTTNIDNTPISVIEAMALGLGMLSTDVGGMHYLVTDGKDGLLVPAKDEVAMTNGVKQLIENPDDTRAMVRKAREKVTAFDWEVVKHDWNKLLE
ncbi:glycosyltransferase family 4 protein [Antarcticibacterium flavum]|uniref:Glycosyltransferase family 4 protein n=1 Tax=Antarcticibacterium flavum TaxID=2058175 RepID=A0A5B7X545_9FLAO|nr:MULTISPECIES: glycosyltransferase family 4 protein [Antarcticibacterium]MCM4161381.1 glycosyl transferase family 1 [Antarcticibacterium sp. W02-3]QCY70594.1 glycosyltransferase family 4 protein [Antarcticibacterium flavum]